MIEVIGAGLGELQYKVSSPVVFEINKQISKIIQDDADPPKSEERE